MTKAELEQLRQRLHELRVELQDLESDSAADGKPVELDQAKVGRLSRMDAMQGQQMALEASRRRQQRLLGIESALRRMDAGKYGRCLDCDEDIDTRRLAADPVSVRCISCAQTLDQV